LPINPYAGALLPQQPEIDYDAVGLPQFITHLKRRAILAIGDLDALLG
jgi:hypothetical protein